MNKNPQVVNRGTVKVQEDFFDNLSITEVNRRE